MPQHQLLNIFNNLFKRQRQINWAHKSIEISYSLVSFQISTTAKAVPGWNQKPKVQSNITYCLLGAHSQEPESEAELALESRHSDTYASILSRGATAAASTHPPRTVWPTYLRGPSVTEDNTKSSISRKAQKQLILGTRGRFLEGCKPWTPAATQSL